MIAQVLVTLFIAGLSTAQYGHGGGYGPDGVRNRYFILGHGRPITTSIGHGIYGPSAGGSAYRSAPAPPRPASYAPAAPSHGAAYGSGRHELSGGPSYGSHSAGSSYEAPSSSYGHSAPAYAPLAPSYGHSVPSYAPATSSYGHSAPQSAHRSYSAPSHGYAPSGHYNSHDDLARPTPYDFGYDVHSDHGDQLTRQETGDGHGNVKGSYGYRDAYGLFRHVDYVADHAGFRANVRTNEPGTAPQDPADVHLQVEHSRPY
nr:DNA-directed RNA polymerase II subunit rpb1 isoform X2 [Parasteatoda tepidariorum]